jgi:MFS family permease
MAMSSSIYNYFFNSAWKNYGTTFLGNISDQKISFILTVGSLCNSFSRIIIGLLLQKFKFRTLYLGILFVQMFSAFTVSHIGTTSYAVYTCYVSVSLFCLGAHITLFPTITSKVFGVEVGRKIYPFVFSCFSVASLA